MMFVSAHAHPGISVLYEENLVIHHEQVKLTFPDAYERDESLRTHNEVPEGDCAG